jgi:hypothetical protein
MRRSLALALMTAAAATLAAGAASGELKRSCDRATVWTSNTSLPLAFVRNNVIEPRKSACDAIERYSTFGRLEAIDRWGQPVGVVFHTSETGRDVFKLLKGSRGTGIFVRTVGKPWAVSSAAASPSPEAKRAVERWLGGIKPRELVFFKADKPGAATDLAVVTTRDAFRVLYLDESDKLRFAYEKLAGPARWPVYRLGAVVDMNGDGLPEVIVHFNEYEDGRGHEILLAPTHGGRHYAEVSDNEDDGP